MKTKYKILLGTFGLIFISFIFYAGAWLFAPGSYARAEIYELAISEDSLVQIIKDIKTENPELDLDQNNNTKDLGLIEGRHGESDHWYHIYFYYPDKNQIVYTWARKLSKTTVSFAFVAVNDGLTLGNWTEVNSEFWWWRNNPVKIEFENRILKKIEEKIKERKPNTVYKK